MPYRYDPELARAAALLPPRDLTDLPATRRAIRQTLAAAPPVDTSGLCVRELDVPGVRGEPDVRVRVYRPSVLTRRVPAILHAHGGGFVMCDLNSSHLRCTELARELGVVVVSVDYRLAPEHPFPAALRDTYGALLWLVEADLGVDPGRVAVHGISAGAGLVAGLALFARDEGGPALCFQYLGIPMLDDRQRTESARRFTDTPQWDTFQNALGWSAYLGDGVPGSVGVSPYAAPARALDLSGLPPTYLSAMEFDPLRDEAIAYAQALLTAGVPTELHVFPGTYHGSVAVRNATPSRRQLAEEITVLRAALSLEGVVCMSTP